MAPIGEADRHLGVVLLDGDAPGAEREVLLAEGDAERSVEVGAVRVVVGRPPAGHGRVGERHAGEEGAVPPVAEVQRERDADDGAERLREPEAV